MLILCDTNLIVGIMWHESYCWLAVARILLLVFGGTNLIVGILWHESHWPASQPAEERWLDFIRVGEIFEIPFRVAVNYSARKVRAV